MGLTVNVFAILGSAAALLAVLWRLVSILLKLRDDLHDNRRAISANTTATSELSSKFDGRMGALETMVDRQQRQIERLHRQRNRQVGPPS